MTIQAYYINGISSEAYLHMLKRNMVFKKISYWKYAQSFEAMDFCEIKTE